MIQANDKPQNTKCVQLRFSPAGYLAFRRVCDIRKNIFRRMAAHGMRVNQHFLIEQLFIEISDHMNDNGSLKRMASSRGNASVVKLKRTA